MSDLERLDEALEVFESIRLVQQGRGGPILLDQELEWLVRVENAARAYRDLLANGERVEWCEVHNATQAPGDLHNEMYEVCYGHLAYRRFAPKDVCRIVSKLLVDPTTEEET